MADRNQIVKLATDIYKGSVNTKFGKEDMEENKAKLYEQLVEINGGKDLSIKKLRNGAGSGLFEIIEDILINTTEEGLLNNPFFQKFGDFRNVAAGDENSFHTPDNSLFLVSEIANGVNGVRRQRINKGKNVVVPTAPHSIKVYAELKRLLAGRIDIVEFIDKMQRSMLEDKLSLTYDTFAAGLSELPAAFTVTGAYVEDSLITILEHVEASTGQKPIIAGTLKALRLVTTAVVADSAKEDLKDLGYYGKFNSYEMMRIPQSHTTDGQFTFKISNIDLWIVAGDVTPVKFVTEGEMLLEVGSAMKNADQTVDIMSFEEYGAGIVINQLYGQYRIQ